VDQFGGKQWDQLMRNLKQPGPVQASASPRQQSHSPTPNNSNRYSTPHQQDAPMQRQLTHSPAPNTNSGYSTPYAAPPMQQTSYPSQPRYDSAQSSTPQYPPMQQYSGAPPQQQYNLPPPSQMVRTSSGGGYGGYRTHSPPRPDYSPLSEHATPRPMAVMQPSVRGEQQQGLGRPVVGLGLEGYKI